MVEIKENDVKMSDLVDKLVPDVIKALEEKGEYRLYRYDSGVAYDTAKALAMRFVNKGYHAKFNHFIERCKGYQCVVISKKPIIDRIGCKLYAEHLG